MFNTHTYIWMNVLQLKVKLCIFCNPPVFSITNIFCHAQLRVFGYFFVCPNLVWIKNYATKVQYARGYYLKMYELTVRRRQVDISGRRRVRRRWLRHPGARGSR